VQVGHPAVPAAPTLEITILNNPVGPRTALLQFHIIHPREIFKPAILANAASVLLAHNHPSGDPTPSAEDMSVTRQLVAAGGLIGIEVLDHVVVGDMHRYVSFREAGMLESTPGANGVAP
jgi:DNA repair protein RadC